MRVSEIECLDDLARLSLPELTAWLRRGGLIWSIEQDRRKRLRAFAPATVFAHIPDEAAGVTLADELATAFDGDVHLPGEAAVRVLEGWSILQDGSNGAALFIQLAGELGASRLRDGLDALINKPDSLSAERSLRLSGAIGIAACERLPRQAAEEIGIDARRAGLITADEATRILLYVCRGRLDRTIPIAAAMRLPERGSSGLNLLMPLIETHDHDELVQALTIPPGSAAQLLSRDWLVEAMSAFGPRKPSPRKWRQRSPQSPSIRKNLEKIKRWIDKNQQQYPESLPEQIFTNMERVSIFDSKADIDPNLDTTKLRNVINIEMKRARRA